MIFLLFACFTSPEKNDETLITIRREKPTRSDYEEVFGDNSSKKGVIIYSYDNEESPFYTQKTDTYTTGSGETFVLDETATLDSDGRWETMTTKSNGVEIGFRDNMEYDIYGNNIYSELTGSIAGFEEEENVNFSVIERTYASFDTITGETSNVYFEDGTPRKLINKYHYMHEFEPCPKTPLFSISVIKEYNEQGELVHDEFVEFDDNGFPTTLSSTINDIDLYFEFSFDDSNKPITMSLINSNGDIPIYTNEFSYVEGKFHSIAVTNYNQYGIANPAQSNQVEISKTETTWENNFRGPLCSLVIKDLDGNYTQNRLEVDAWTETNLRVTQVDPSGEQIGYLIIEHDLFAFDVPLE